MRARGPFNVRLAIGERRGQFRPRRHFSIFDRGTNESRGVVPRLMTAIDEMLFPPVRLEYGHAPNTSSRTDLRSRTGFDRGLDRQVDLIEYWVLSHRVRAASGWGGRYRDLLVNGDRLGIDDAQIHVGRMRALSQGIMAIARIEPDLVIAALVVQNLDDVTVLLVDDCRVLRAGVAGRPLCIAAKQNLRRWASRHSLWSGTLGHGDVECLDNLKTVGIDDDDIPVGGVVAATVHLGEVQIERMLALVPIALFDAVGSIWAVADADPADRAGPGSAVEYDLLHDRIVVRPDEADVRIGNSGVVGHQGQVIFRIPAALVRSIVRCCQPWRCS